MVGFALEFHALPARESQIRPVPGAALALTVATLAVVHHQRFAADFITDRAAGASTGISLAHACSPYSAVGSLRGHRASAFARLPKSLHGGSSSSRQFCSSVIAPSFWTTFFQPALIFF